MDSNITNEEFEKIIKDYGKIFNNSGFLEKTIPKKLST
jgi:hypothetical protein